jgi:catalase
MSTPASPESVIAVMERYTGTQAGYRRAHARGLVVHGRFQATPEAAKLSRAEHLQGASIPCLVRLSNAAGNPHAPDQQSVKESAVFGLGVRFQLPSGGAASWAAATIPAFPARSSDEFVALTTNLHRGKNGKPNPFRALFHLLTHRHILPVVKVLTRRRPVGSFAVESYDGVHTYYFVSAAGERKPFRYRWVPRLPLVTLTPAEVKGRGPHHLLDELRARLAKGPVVWDLVARFPEPGDPLDDATAIWPASRPTAILGSLTLERLHEDQRAVEGMVFDPTGVVPGLELSDDPLLKLRAQVYGLSYDRRSKEARAEAPPPDMGQ